MDEKKKERKKTNKTNKIERLSSDIEAPLYRRKKLIL